MQSSTQLYYGTNIASKDAFRSKQMKKQNKKVLVRKSANVAAPRALLQNSACNLALLQKRLASR
jgi:hypothetical protein